MTNEKCQMTYGKWSASSRSIGFNDPSPANDLLLAVEDRSLARGDSSLGLIEHDVCSLVLEWGDGSWGFSMAIADTHVGTHGSCRPVVSDPVHAGSGKLPAQ